MLRQRRLRPAMLAVTLVISFGLLGCGSVPNVAAGPKDGWANWPAYLDGPIHHSVQTRSSSITSANAASLTQAWHWIPDPPPIPALGTIVWSSPTVVNGVIYVGANNGTFYALNENTGAVIWKRYFAYQPKFACLARGFFSTATVQADPVTGNLTVYVAAADGYLYALDASTGQNFWQSLIAVPSTTQNDYFNWSSPTVLNGNIYIGSASNCDLPLTQGFLAEYSQATGTQENIFYTVPTGSLGGGVWTSPVVAPDGSIVMATGTKPKGTQAPGYSVALVHVTGNTLSYIESFTVPLSEQIADGDYGGSPTMFKATVNGTSTSAVAACNKNGIYYALALGQFATGPLWETRIGQAGTPTGGSGQCYSSAAYDGTRLYIGGPPTTIGTKSFKGSVQALDPNTGVPIWQTGLPDPELAPPSINAAGVIAAATMNYNGPASAYLLSASTGQILATLNIGGSAELAQPVFADNYLFLGTSNGIYAYKP